MLGFQVYPAITSPRTLKDTRYSKGEQRITKSTTSNACITNWCMPDNVETFVPNNNPTFFYLIKHTQEHMEGGNRVWMDVMGCLTPSPRITKSSNPSLVQDLVFMHILIKIIKPSRHKWPITHSISWWLVATPNLVFLLPIAKSTDMLEHTHTHTHTHIQAHKHKARFRWAQWGSESGTIEDDFPASTAWQLHWGIRGFKPIVFCLFSCLFDHMSNHMLEFCARISLPTLLWI